jgi:hypothetical protein
VQEARYAAVRHAAKQARRKSKVWRYYMADYMRGAHITLLCCYTCSG